MMSGLSLVLNCKGPASNSTPTFYTVSFDAQGGSTVESLTVEHGKTIEKPTDPVKASFTFSGWHKERECTTPWNFTTDTVTADITLYAKWIPIPPATVTVTFTVKGGNGTLTAKAGNTELTSPASVKKDTDVAFTPTPSTGYEVDYLLINGEKKSGTTVTVKADKNITAIVKFKTQGAPETQLFTVDYKAEPAAGGSISAKYSDGTAFSSGGKIETGTNLVFTAEPNSGYDISTWTGAAASPDKKTATLTVTANSSVTVMFIKQHAVNQYTVNFDTQGGSPVASVKVEHGKTVTKPADPVKASFTFGGWYKERECTTRWNFATDTVTADITLYAKWQTTSTTSITIHFDPYKMRCFKRPGFSPVYNNDTVYKGDLLQFEATPQSGQLLNKWTVNGVEQGYATNERFQYSVHPWDVQSGSITIDYTVKPAAQVTIHFDSGKIACDKTYANVHDGETVYENDKLNFVAKLSPGQLVDKWKVNGVEKEDKTNKNFRYTVRTEDAQSGSITIDYTVKPSPQGTIHFDSSKIGCYYSLIMRVVNDGETVYENDSLVFYAKNLPPGKTVNKWKVNGVEKEDETETSFSYTVKAEDVQSGSITIGYTLK
jgi:multidomain protein with s-layer homology region, glug motif, ig motif, i-set domain